MKALYFISFSNIYPGIFQLNIFCIQNLTTKRQKFLRISTTKKKKRKKKIKRKTVLKKLIFSFFVNVDCVLFYIKQFAYCFIFYVARYESRISINIAQHSVEILLLSKMFYVTRKSYTFRRL